MDLNNQHNLSDEIAEKDEIISVKLGQIIDEFQLEQITNSKSR